MIITVVKHDDVLGDLTGNVDVKTFGQLMKVDRSITGLDTIAYAKLLGVSRQTIYNTESGQTEFDKLKMAGFAALRGYDVNGVLEAFYKEES